MELVVSNNALAPIASPEKKGLLIFGAGQVAQVFADYLMRQGCQISAYVVDAAYWEPATFIGGIPVVAFENLAMTHLPENYRFTVGMSFKNLNAIRASKFEAMLLKGYEPITFKHGMCGVGRGVKIGQGSFVMDLNNFQTEFQCGDNCVFWAGNHFGHHTKVGNHVFVASHAVIGGSVEIGDFSFIGVNATIRDNVKIGKRCVIGAGALILSDCEDDGVYAPGGTQRSKVPSFRLRGI